MGKFVVCAVPFAAEDIPVIMNLTEFKPEYVVGSVVTPAGLGLEDKDIGVIENRNELGYTVTSNLKESIKSCNIVLILSKDMSSPLYDYGIKAIEEAIRQRKDIFCLLKLDKKTREYYKEICQEKNINFRCFLPESLPHSSYKDMSKPLYHPYAPVVFIGELAEDVQGYEVFCGLVKMCRDKGIKVSAIGPEASNGLFGFHAIDFSVTKDEPGSMVYRINKYVRELEERENPAIIIVKLPKPMIKFDDVVRYDFGISAYLISQAISASFFMVCSPYGFLSDQFWDNMSNNFQAKFGYGINAIHISNKIIDSTDQTDKSNLSFIHLPVAKAQADIEQAVGESVFLMGNLTDLHQMEKIVIEIEESLLNTPYGLIM